MLGMWDNTRRFKNQKRKEKKMNTYGNNYYGNAYAPTGGQDRSGASAEGQPPWLRASDQPAYQRGFNDGESAGMTIGSILLVGLLGLGACGLMKKGGR